MCQILSNGKDKDLVEILELLLPSIQQKIKEYSEQPSFNHLMLIQNYISFFMILVLNLSKYPSFIKIIFEGKLNFFKNLCDLLFAMKTKKRKKLLSILNNMFLDEYKRIFFRKPKDESLEDLFIKQQIEFSARFLETSSFYNEDTYKKMYQILLNFDISYANFFSNNSKIKDEEKPAYKLCIAQSLIRVAFSKEKKNIILKKIIIMNIIY